MFGIQLAALLFMWHQIQDENPSLSSMGQSLFRQKAELGTPPSNELSCDSDETVAYLLYKYNTMANMTKQLVTQYNKFKSMSKYKATISGNSGTTKTLEKEEQLLAEIAQLTSRTKVSLKVATYNIWHDNPPLDLRIKAIIDEIKTIDPDIIGFQEVKMWQKNGSMASITVLDQIGEQLPAFPYKAFQNTSVSEGLGLLSKYPIVATSVLVLQTATMDDTNKRICLHTLVNTSTIGLINIFVTHLTYGDKGQCMSVIKLFNFTNSFDPGIPQILLGDMNTYFDFEWPLDFLTGQGLQFVKHKMNPCSLYWKEISFSSLGMERWNPVYFSDAWEQFINTHTKLLLSGNTFTTFDDQDPSRPDRILVRSEFLLVTKVSIFGNNFIVTSNATTNPSDHRGVLAYFFWYNYQQLLTYEDKVKQALSWKLKLKPQLPKLKLPKIKQ